MQTRALCEGPIQRIPGIAASVAVFSLFAAQFAIAEVIAKTRNVSGATVHYKVVLPNHYDANKEYPGVLAFPGGAQTLEMVDTMIDRNWRKEAETRGYIVVVPAAPDGDLFFERGARVFPQFLTDLLEDYKIERRKFHIAGNSNGGISAFHIAASYPQYFLSVTGFPGYLPEATPARVRAISKMCINMHVGELDQGWPEEMATQSKQFSAQGFKVRFTVEKGQAHRLNTFAGEGAARLFNQFEEARQGCGK